MNSDAAHAENFAPKLGQLSFSFVARFNELVARSRIDDWRWQHRRSSLPVVDMGSRDSGTMCAGHMNSGSDARNAERTASGVSVSTRLDRNHIGDELRTADGVGDRHDGGGADSRQSCQRGFDFSRLNPEAANFDLTIRPTDKFESAIRPPTHSITGAIHALACEFDESLCC